MSDLIRSQAETTIHPSAVIDPRAELDVGVTVEPFAVIEGNVTIGKGTIVGSSTRIASGSRIGNGVRIYHGAAIGTPPQDLKYANEPTEAYVGDRTIIRECATVHRGTTATGRTTVGSDCMIMAYAHVAHDNALGNHVILANAVQLGGHVHLEDWVIIGGGTVVHQFCTIGAHAMVGGGFRVTQDVLPYVVCGGYPLKALSLNRVGLERRGFTADQIKSLSRIFRIVCRSKLNLTQAVERLREEMNDSPEARQMIAFIERAERGVIR